MSTFGQVLKEAGEFGLFQKWLLLALCFPSLFSAFNAIGQVFTGLSFPHHCNTDWILERGPNLTQERRRNLTLPVNKHGQVESCRMFTPVDWDLETIEDYGINSTSQCLHGWDYEAPFEFSSIVTEMDLVCEKNGFIEASQSMFMAGCMIGCLLFGGISDRFGRRFATLSSLFGLFLSGVGTAFSPNIYVYMILKFFCGVTGVLVMQATVIGIEWTGPSHSAFLTTMILLSYPVGLMMLPGIAYFISNWRTLQLVYFSPLILLVGMYYWLLPESARWLMTQGKKEEVQKELLRAARVNGRKIPQNLIDKLEIEDAVKKESVLNIFTTPYLRNRTFILGFIWWVFLVRKKQKKNVLIATDSNLISHCCWATLECFNLKCATQDPPTVFSKSDARFSSSVLYYGLSLNVGTFGLNIFLTQFIFGIVEIPAVLSNFIITQHFGRRLSQAGFLFLGGVACLSILAIPKDFPLVVTIIAVLGKYFVSASFATAYVYSPELYPTTLRQNGVGVNSMCGRVAGTVTPLIRLLEVYHHMIPMLIYGIFPLIAGCFCLLLPETLNVELQDHTEVKKLNAVPAKDESAMDKLLKV